MPIRNINDIERSPTSGVVPGSFTNASITVDTYGRVTAASSGAGGADPWTYVTLGGDVSVSVVTNEDVTGLSFAPANSKTYEVEGVLLLRTSITTTGPRPGIKWPTAGLTDKASTLYTPNSNTAQAMQLRGATATANAASTGLPTTTDSYMAELRALIITTTGVVGAFQVTLASEVAASSVTIKAGSFIRYRTIP